MTDNEDNQTTERWSDNPADWIPDDDYQPETIDWIREIALTLCYPIGAATLVVPLVWNHAKWTTTFSICTLIILIILLVTVKSIDKTREDTND